MKTDSYPKVFPPEQQEQQPGLEHEMQVKPEYIRQNYKGSDKLINRVALITGGDSGIGRSVAIHFAREGADVAISYVERESKDAEETKKLVEREGRKCLLLPGDLRHKQYCYEIVDKTVKELGKLNVLVLNAAIQHASKNLVDMKDEDIEDTFNVNILSMFRVTKEALKHLKEGDAIICNTSINAYRGNKELVDYTSTKGAILGFSRSMAMQLAEKKIKVNAVAPGPIWTPLIVSSFDKEHVKNFGKDSPLGRAGQPAECGPAFVFLASEDSSYFTGQCLHPNGGYILNT
jgi:NAD(P)-dependent dehydrogenase (short-subunit alcohol dehydrogenase family)